MCYLFGNRLMAQEPKLYDVVFHEIFADPSPSHGLPLSEYIEIRNTGNKEIDLKNWTIYNGSTYGKISTSLILKPDSILLLSPSSFLSQFLSFGQTATVTPWPTLNNEGDTLILFSPSGAVIHALAWNKEWYENSLKEEGGWSIEMKDASQPCAGKENWLSSIDPMGGTPGTTNSITEKIKDESAPVLNFAYMPDSITIIMVFSEPVIPNIFLKDIIIDDLLPKSIDVVPPFFNLVKIVLAKAAQKEAIYSLKGLIVSDCKQHKSDPGEIKFGRFSTILPSDVIINEILFNPLAGGFDYVEIYNHSEKIVDLSSLYLSNRNSSGNLSSILPVMPIRQPLFPGEFIALTEDINWIKKQYSVGELNIVLMHDMPSFPDDNGTVILLDNRGIAIDELGYDEKWHSALIHNREGISLERINVSSATQDPYNWHSASTSSGYGTPGYVNSQSSVSTTTSSPLMLNTNVISPDMDGKDDFLIIQYHFTEPGYIANVTVFDANGNPVNYLARNALCGREGFFRWDGMDDNHNALAKGHYIILTDLFHINGTTKRFRNAIGLFR